MHVGVCGNDEAMNVEAAPAQISLCLKARLPARKRRTPFLCKSCLDCVSLLNLNNVHTDTIRLHRGRGGWERHEGFILTMTMPPDCSAVHMLIMGAMPMVVPWK